MVTGEVPVARAEAAVAAAAVPIAALTTEQAEDATKTVAVLVVFAVVVDAESVAELVVAPEELAQSRKQGSPLIVGEYHPPMHREHAAEAATADAAVAVAAGKG